MGDLALAGTNPANINITLYQSCMDQLLCLFVNYKARYLTQHQEAVESTTQAVFKVQLKVH